MEPAHILSLPDELLVNIFSNLVDSGSLLDGQSREGVDALCALALTCRRFTPIAREALLDTPVLVTGKLGPSHKRIVSLIQLLLKYPALQNTVRGLRVEVNHVHGLLDYMTSMRRFKRGKKRRAYCRNKEERLAKQGFLKQCLDVARLVSSEAWAAENRQSYLSAWRLALEDGSEPAFVGILLMLLPNLEHLVLLPVQLENLSPSIVDLFGLDQETMASPKSPFNSWDWSWGPTPRLEKLKSAKFRSDHPPKALNFLESLETLDLSLGSGHNHAISHFYYHITELRMGTTLESIRGRSANLTMILTFFNICEVIKRFPYLKTFRLYDDSAAIKDIDELEVDTSQPFCFDNLLDELSKHNPELETLTLPDNWFRSKTDRYHGVINSMGSFKTLKHVSLPECAIKGRSGSFIHVQDENNKVLLHPLEQIGSTLQSLRIVNPSFGSAEESIQSLFSWLNQLMGPMFWELKNIRVVLGVSRKLFCRKLLVYSRYGKLLERLSNMGICLTVECVDKAAIFDPTTYRQGTDHTRWVDVMMEYWHEEGCREEWDSGIYVE